MPKNNLPLFFEELKIKEDITLQNLIAQFKRTIPINYLEITLEEGNYGGSTNPKWKNKPLSERYFFTYQGKEIQLDIPHSLMEKLGLEKGQDITQPLYLDPQVLKRTEIYKGITLENEQEIILIDPKKIVVKEVEAQTGLSSETLEEKINQLNQQTEELRVERDDLKEKYNQIRINVSNILYPKIEGAALAESDRELVDQAEMVIKKLNDLKAELDKEKGWWDKWISDNNEIKKYKIPCLDNSSCGYYLASEYEDPPRSMRLIIGERIRERTISLSQHRKIVKLIYEYYKNK